MFTFLRFPGSGIKLLRNYVILVRSFSCLYLCPFSSKFFFIKEKQQLLGGARFLHLLSQSFSEYFIRPSNYSVFLLWLLQTVMMCISVGAFRIGFLVRRWFFPAALDGSFSCLPVSKYCTEDLGPFCSSPELFPCAASSCLAVQSACSGSSGLPTRLLLLLQPENSLSQIVSY